MPRVGQCAPFSITDVLHGGGALTLAPGQMFYPPSGNYWWQPGDETVLQMWNPIQGLWGSIAQPDSGLTSFNTDGFNFRLVNLSGVVTGANITAAGSGGTNGIGTAVTGVTVLVAAPGATGGGTALAYPIVGGSVPAPTITAAGGPFSVAPLVVCDPPPLGGIQATFAATLNSAGGLGSIAQINPGAGYPSVPNFYVIPQTQFYQGAPSGGVAAALLIPPGVVNPNQFTLTPTPAPGYNYATSSASLAGALLTPNALTGSGTLTGIVFYYYGSLYTGTTIPAITVTGCGAAAATAIMSMCMTGFSSVVGGATYGAGNPPNFETSLGLIATANNNLNLLPRAARGVMALAGGAITATGAVIEDAGFGFQKVPVAAVLNTSAVPGTLGTFVPVVGGVNDTSILQDKVSA